MSHLDVFGLWMDTSQKGADDQTHFNEFPLITTPLDFQKAAQ